MAGLGRRTFAAGEVLTASNVMGYLQDQAVMNFAGTAARGSAIGTAVSEGMVTYLADSNVIEAYDGSAWMNVATTGRGIVAFNGTVTGTSISPGVPLTIMTTTFTAYPGRKYRFTGRFPFQLGNTSTVRALYIWNNTIGNIALQYTTVGMASSNYNDTFQGSVTLNSSELGVTSSPVSGYGVEMRFYTGSSGSYNANPDGVLGANSNRAQLVIEDIGVSS